MNAKAEKRMREATRAVQREVRESFKQDFEFFRSTVLKMPFFKRLMFCRDVMLKRISPSAG